MRKKQPTPTTRPEDALIRELLTGQRLVVRPFQPEMEAQFWDTLAKRSIRMINSAVFPATIAYLLLGLINLPIMYWFSWDYFRTHELYTLAYTYAIGIFCLAVLPILFQTATFSRNYFYWIVGIVSFIGVFSTSYFSLQFKTPWVAQAATYVVILVYILIYFVIGMKPKFILTIGLSAGLLAFLVAYMQTANYDFVWYSNEEIVRYFYYMGLINFVGFAVMHMNLAKERVNFLQARLLELDKINAEAMSDELKRLSQEDPVTGLANRRFLNQRLEDEWERSQRSHEPISILFIDIDHFKAYNDAYGHLKGDEALYAVAQTLPQFLSRSTDLASRYGGEEFLVMLPNTPELGARVVADKIMAAVDAMHIEHRKSKTGKYVTVSIGVATCNFDDPELTSAILIQQADEAVYKAKADGRHRIREYRLMNH